MDFFTSDNHFGHEKIIKHCKRPFTSTEDMDATMIKSWNETVSKKDNVFIIGDFFWKSNTEYCVNIISQLNGYKYLILGSHDNFLDKTALRPFFVFIKKYHSYKNNNIRAVLFHNPLYSWDGMGKGVFHFFGHVHNKYLCINNNTMTYNVGVDLNGFRPISINQIFMNLNNLIGNKND
jgi:calcineurin-like phosphoesterase family protein